MLPELPPQTPPQYFDRTLRIKGVDISLRVFPFENKFVFQTQQPLSEGEKAMFSRYLQNEGFLDNPITGAAPQQVIL